MKIRIVSDLHKEFGFGQINTLDVMPGEDEQVLVIAGDLGVATYPDSYIPFLKDAHSRFRQVIYIMGNHEHYHGSFLTTYEVIKRNIADAGLSDKVSIAEKEVIQIDDVDFICATLWTDMDKENPNTMFRASQFMNDYEQTRMGTEGDEYLRQLWASDTVADHNQALEFIFGECHKSIDSGRKIVVVGHHGPSHQSISMKYRDSKVNGAFVSELSYDISALNYPMVWIHGHVHQNHNYFIDQAEVVCNPHGYGKENPNFDHCLVRTI